MRVLRGFVEAVRPFQIRGWALDTERPDVAVEVQALLGDKPLAGGRADMFRDDLVAVGSGSGRHGFVLNLSSRLLEDEHKLVVVQVRDESGAEVRLNKLAPSVPVAPAATETAGIVERIVASRPDPHPSLSQWVTSDAAHHPVFVLGSARSGTSALAQGLVSATRYQGPEEGHLLDIITPLRQAVDTHYEKRGEEWSQRPTMIAEIPKSFFDQALRHIMVELARRMFPEGYWIDKTPRVTMTAIAPILKDIWPGARFIFMKRRGIENVQSRIRKFPAIPFREHCLDWQRSMDVWRKVRDSLGGSAVEIDQMVLAREPNRVVDALTGLLWLSQDEVERLRTALAFDRPERTSETFGTPTRLGLTGWSEADQECFAQICAPVMRAFRYDDAEPYFERGASEAGLVVL